MIIQIIDPHHFDQRTEEIRAQVSAVLTRWGLLPRFNRWRLTQDPSSGMIVLFGVLNTRYIATHTSIPFSDYFEPSLLHDLANELQMQVISCNSDGLRYAFILDRGQLVKLPTHIDFPYIDDSKQLVRVAFSDYPQTMPALPAALAKVDDQTRIREGVSALLKVFDDIELRKDAADLLLSGHFMPDIQVIEETEFKRRVAEKHEANRQKNKLIKKLFDKKAG